MTNVLSFPRNYRQPLPPDAYPRGRDRHAEVFPFDGAWAYLETDDGGGSFTTNLTKPAALKLAMEVVIDYGGTMSLDNKPPEHL